MAKAAKSSKVSADLKFTDQDFDLFSALDALDRKDYGYYSRLTPEQQRKFVPYMMLQWISVVNSKTAISAYYLMSANQNANVHMFNERIQQHPELQWLMLCTVSPGVGKQYRKWLPQIRPAVKQLREAATVKEIGEYLTKVSPKTSAETITECAEQYVADQRHKRRLAQMYPAMKIEDINVLAVTVRTEDIDQYEKDSGN